MLAIALPGNGCVRTFAFSLSAVCVLVPLMMPTYALAQVLTSLVMGCCAWLLWRRYQRLRPRILRIHGRDRMDCCSRDADDVAISEVRVGLVTPWLLSATLRTRDDVARHLFVPACSVSHQEHWQLRRFLLAWHSPDEAGDGI